MATTRKTTGETAAEPIDVTDLPELRDLVEAVRSSGTPRLLRVAGRDAARLTPVQDDLDADDWPIREITDEDRAAALSAAGSWKGLVDAEQLKADLAAARGQADCDWPPLDQPRGR